MARVALHRRLRDHAAHPLVRPRPPACCACLALHAARDHQRTLQAIPTSCAPVFRFTQKVIWSINMNRGFRALHTACFQQARSGTSRTNAWCLGPSREHAAGRCNLTGGPPTLLPALNHNRLRPAILTEAAVMCPAHPTAGNQAPTLEKLLAFVYLFVSLFPVKSHSTRL